MSRTSRDDVLLALGRSLHSLSDARFIDAVVAARTLARDAR